MSPLAAGFDQQARAQFAARADQFWLTHVCINVHVCARLGVAEHAAALLELLEPQAHLIAATAAVCLFSPATCAGMLATLLEDHDAADRHFANALELTERFGAPYLVATAQLEWGRSLLSRTPANVGVARPLLEAALATSREHGYSEIERDSAELL